MTYFQRGLLATGCILLGFLFFPLFFLGGFIAWSVYRDIVEEPARRAQQAELDARIPAPVSVEDLRFSCDSPAEEAFLDAMVSAYALQAGPGAIEGRGLRLRNQVSMGRLRIHSGYVSSQYRADFLIDDELVVEVDGAAYHSSPEAVARDRQRDSDMKREGYSVLRIPAKVVFGDPAETVKRVEDARLALRSSRCVGTNVPISNQPTTHKINAHCEAAIPLNSLFVDQHAGFFNGLDVPRGSNRDYAITESLDPNSEYLVATGLSGTELAQKIAELVEMRGLIEIATFQPMSEHRHWHLQRQLHQLSYPIFYVTFFVVSPEQYVLARVHEPSHKDEPWTLELSIVEGSSSEFRPFRSLEGEERDGFHDNTMPGLENDVPTISKNRALAAIDRWIRLLSNPLPQTAPSEPPPAAVACARDFLGSVAALAKKQEVPEYALSGPDEDPAIEEFTVTAEFSTACQLPQVSFTGCRNDDWGHQYEYLTREAAAIYACALPTIIAVAKTWRSFDGDRAKGPFGLYFDNWRSPELPFEPSTAMDHVLGHLPRLPRDAIIPPIFSED